MRLDIELVNRDIFGSRQKAKEAIRGGRVKVNGKVCTKPALDVDENTQIETESLDNDFVGRGGHKLFKMLDKHNIDLSGLTCMDIGASTGGFTQCMLRFGAEHVYAVDVGTGQLAPELCADSRVSNMEKTDIRNVKADDLEKLPDLISVDVSFISLKLILPKMHELLKDSGIAVCLIKPQFEAGRKNVGKKGIVKDPKVHISVLEDITAFAGSVGFKVEDVDYSPIQGGSGNIEYLMLIKKNDTLITNEFDYKMIVGQAFTASKNK